MGIKPTLARKYVQLTVVWGNGDVDSTIKVSRRRWEAILGVDRAAVHLEMSAPMLARYVRRIRLTRRVPALSALARETERRFPDDEATPRLLGVIATKTTRIAVSNQRWGCRPPSRTSYPADRRALTVVPSR